MSLADPKAYNPRLINRRPLLYRLFEGRERVWPMGLAIAAFFILAQLTVYLFTNYFDTLPAEVAVTAYPIHMWYDLAHAVVMGYVITGVEILRRGFACNLQRINPALRTEIQPEDHLDVDWSGRILVTLLFGLPMAAAVLVPLHAEDHHPAAMALMQIRLPLMFTVIAIGVYDIWRLTRTFSTLVETHLKVDLIQPQGLEPIAQFALRTAAFLALGVALAAPMVLDAPTAIQTSITLLVLAIASIWLLLLPALAARRLIRAEKERQDSAIAKELARAIKSGNRAEMAGLIAWRNEIRQVREWIFSTETNLRFFILALVPIASWIVGALTEGVLDRVLGN